MTHLRGPDDIVPAFRARADAIEITREHLDFTSGVGERNSAHFLSVNPIKGGTQSKRIGMATFFALADGLGYDVVLIENPEKMERIRQGLTPRDVRRAIHAATVKWEISAREMRKRRKKGGHNSRKYMSKRQATRLARKAINTRWEKYRAAKATKPYHGLPPNPTKRAATPAQHR